jgi:hypothetical protein
VHCTAVQLSLLHLVGLACLRLLLLLLQQAPLCLHAALLAALLRLPLLLVVSRGGAGHCLLPPP